MDGWMRWCVCVCCVCGLLQFAYPGRDNGLPLVEVNLGIPSGQRPCGSWGSSTQPPLSRTTASNPCMCSEAPMEGLLGPGILRLFNPHPPKEAAGKRLKDLHRLCTDAARSNGSAHNILLGTERPALPTSQPATDGLSGRRGRSTAQLNPLLALGDLYPQGDPTQGVCAPWRG